MNQPRHRGGLTWQASFTIAVLIVVALYIVGSVKGATLDTVTPRFMARGLHAISYPVRTRTVTCRSVGASGLAEFRCVAHITHRRQRRFVARMYGGDGGWICAGKTLGDCKLLQHGFYPAAAATIGWQGNAVAGWIGIKTGAYPGQIPCTGTSSPVTCDNVVLTYRRVGPGYVMTAKQG